MFKRFKTFTNTLQQLSHLLQTIACKTHNVQTLQNFYQYFAAAFSPFTNNCLQNTQCSNASKLLPILCSSFPTFYKQLPAKHTMFKCFKTFTNTLQQLSHLLQTIACKTHNVQMLQNFYQYFAAAFPPFTNNCLQNTQCSNVSKLLPILCSSFPTLYKQLPAKHTMFKCFNTFTNTLQQLSHLLQTIACKTHNVQMLQNFYQYFAAAFHQLKHDTFPETLQIKMSSHVSVYALA
jgi:hypothetical protein